LLEQVWRRHLTKFGVLPDVRFAPTAAVAAQTANRRAILLRLFCHHVCLESESQDFPKRIDIFRDLFA
jgi:hypothetical protein